DLGVGQEGHLGTAPERCLGGSEALQGLHGPAPLEAGGIHGAVAGDLDVQPGRQGVHHRDPDAVEASGDLVALALELTAGVELGHDDLDRGAPLALGRVDRDAAAVVPDGDGVVGVDGDVDAVGEPGKGLVDGVVHDLDHQVVQATRPGGADVHPGAP